MPGSCCPSTHPLTLRARLGQPSPARMALGPARRDSSTLGGAEQGHKQPRLEDGNGSSHRPCQALGAAGLCLTPELIPVIIKSSLCFRTFKMQRIHGFGLTVLAAAFQRTLSVQNKLSHPQQSLQSCPEEPAPVPAPAASVALGYPQTRGKFKFCLLRNSYCLVPLISKQLDANSILSTCFPTKSSSKGMTKLLPIPAWIYDFLKDHMDAFACLFFHPSKVRKLL